MKTMTLLSLIAGAVLLHSAAHAQQQAEPVTQVIVDESVFGFSEQPRLLNAYLAAELEPSAYWPSSRVVTAEQTQKLAERRTQVLERLQQLTRVAQAEGEKELAAEAQAYAEQLQSWPLIGAEWIGLTKIDDRIDVQSGVSFERRSLYSSFNQATASLQANPLLPQGTLQILPPRELGAWQVTVVSPAGVQKLPFGATDTVRGVLQQAGVFKQRYDLESAYLIALTGLSRSTDVAYYNDAKVMPPVHGLIFVGLDLSAMGAEWQSLNTQLRALLSYWNPQS
ncbi:capsule biosynthesis GfcC D2 domain-containing protein [Pseudidiomarina salilacus]|uniref:capsule biosynthesis GfcC D2 domain-containing protein n=1 Tax=Pseudidiomarina salilacus TaxID=3384452 RepID=UPI003984D029